MDQKGQIILILLLIMTVALAIGLALVQRSITDISTSSRLEESSRAFSAAEAGLEKVLGGSGSLPDTPLENNSVFNVKDSGLLPADKQALEYPPISKEEIAHVWLADFKTSIDKYYDQQNLDVYWGFPEAATATNSEKPALEVTIVYKDAAGVYQNKKFYLDPVNSRTPPNGFQTPANPGPDISNFNCGTSASPIAKINTIFSKDQAEDRQFYCKARLNGSAPILVLLRARLLYSNSSHPFAVAPIGSCATDPKPCSLPKQVKIVLSKGTSGSTQRSIQLFKIDKVVPFFLDYAIFSSGAINK